MAVAGGEPIHHLNQVEGEESSSENQALNVSNASEDELHATIKKKDIVSVVAVAKAVIDEYLDFNQKKQVTTPTDALEVEPVSRYLTILQGGLNCVLRFLENPDSGRLRQHEGALRGLLKLAEAGSIIVSFGILYLASEVLEVRQDFSKPQIDFVKNKLGDVRNQVLNIGQLVERASKILTDIIEETTFNDVKARQFDDCILQARGEIEQCEDTLSCADKILQEIFWRLQGRRWAFVGTKFLCIAGLLYGSYKLFKDASFPMHKAAGAAFAGGATVSMIAWKIPTADEVYKNLMKLHVDYMDLKLELRRLTIKMKSVVDRRTALGRPST